MPFLQRDNPRGEKGARTMPEQAEDVIIRNLVESLNRLHDDLARLEVWSAALSCFRDAPPEYKPDNAYLLPRRPTAR